MAVPKKGLRKIVVEGKTFFWKQESLLVTDADRNFLGYCHDALDFPTAEQVFVPGENYANDPYDFEMVNADYVKDNMEYFYDGRNAHPKQIARWIKENVLNV